MEIYFIFLYSFTDCQNFLTCHTDWRLYQMRKQAATLYVVFFGANVNAPGTATQASGTTDYKESYVDWKNIEMWCDLWNTVP